jgi:lipopolysaccharide/colanic/teichoic acid biosynthesis glycosyltransferase
MRKEPGFIYRICLLFGDALAIVFSFSFAYYFRTHIDVRPFFFTSELTDFIVSNLILLPIWLVIMVSLGTYNRSVLSRPMALVVRLFLASILGVMSIITYDFFVNNTTIASSSLFPVRGIAVLTAVFCFITLIIERCIISSIRRFFFRRSVGLIRTIIVGDSQNTTQLLMGIWPETGFKVVGVVAKDKYVPEEWKKRQYDSLDTAVKNLRPDAIIHTGGKNIEEVNRVAINHHALYYYSPANDSIITLSGRVEWIAATPIVLIRTTPLHSGARALKRFIDIITSLFFIILTSPFMLIVFIAQKIADPKAPAIYKDIRLTRFDKEFGLYKFRSMKQEFSGLTPEQAFEKMGKPELAEKYRAQGDYLANDPRYTKLGAFLRKTSLDEIPQFFNILKGDISLIGPRALQPAELKTYGDRSLILSVKSGLTGLAQVSGRRDISFNERRALDVYYVQNWSIALDISIFLRTIAAVLKHVGAK